MKWRMVFRTREGGVRFRCRGGVPPPIGGLLCLTFHFVNLQYGGCCAKGVRAVEANF